jgi:hypothetical protein
MLSSAVSDESLRRRPQGLLCRAPAAGSDWFNQNQEEEKISSEIFDADVEEPTALLLFRV